MNIPSTINLQFEALDRYRSSELFRKIIDLVKFVKYYTRKYFHKTWSTTEKTETERSKSDPCFFDIQIHGHTTVKNKC